MEPKEVDFSLYSPAPLSSSSTRWWSRETVAVVTGANKGIGFAVVKRFAELGLTVVLTARDVGRGNRAAETLRQQGLRNVHFFPLDVSDPASINAFVSWLQTTFQALDVLVNNAAVSFNEIDENSVEYAETVIKTNYHGPKLLTESLLPLFRRSASLSRILNISSRLGTINKMRNLGVKATLRKENLREEEIERVVKMFVEDVKKGRWENKGWPEIWTDYSMSKLALNAYSRVLAKRFENEGIRRRISINCFCPGFTRTSMTGGTGTHTPDDAAQLAASLALLPPQRLPNGTFFLGFGPYNKSRL